jgi:hypothetical protein
MSEMTPEQIREEIREARRIIREDKIIVGQKAIHDKLSKHFPDEPIIPEGTPPSPEPIPPSDVPPKKKGKWWGDAIDG